MLAEEEIGYVLHAPVEELLRFQTAKAGDPDCAVEEPVDCEEQSRC